MPTQIHIIILISSLPVGLILLRMHDKIGGISYGISCFFHALAMLFISIKLWIMANDADNMAPMFAMEGFSNLFIAVAVVGVFVGVISRK